MFLGINLIDTADAYGGGHSECGIGQVLQARHSNCFVATKVGNQRCDPFSARKNFDYDYMVMTCESSLRRLRRKVIDLYQLPNPRMAVIKSNSVWETLVDEMLKAEASCLTKF
ncbi:MAG: aldo/keto reductase [Candidatus Aerophobus sp.]|nr:MAG: aldo/keto reductase [Candidatus Aerophobus sp.]